MTAKDRAERALQYRASSLYTTEEMRDAIQREIEGAEADLRAKLADEQKRRTALVQENQRLEKGQEGLIAKLAEAQRLIDNLNRDNLEAAGKLAEAEKDRDDWRVRHRESSAKHHTFTKQIDTLLVTTSEERQAETGEAGSVSAVNLLLKRYREEREKRDKLVAKVRSVCYNLEPCLVRDVLEAALAPFQPTEEKQG